MKILITGGTGTISSGLAREAAIRGHEVVALTRGMHDYRNVENVRYIITDVHDAKRMRNDIGNEKFDIIIDCLSYTKSELKNTLSCVGDLCEKFVFISTTAIYAREKGEEVREDAPKTVIEWAYAKNKIECEEYLISFCKEKSINYTIIRPAVTYGDYRVPFPVVSRRNQWTLFNRIQQGRPIIACNNVRFSVIHIEDFSRAVIGVLEKEDSINNDFHIIDEKNIIYWDDVLEVAAEYFDKKIVIAHIPTETFKKYFPNMYGELKWNKADELLLSSEKLKKTLPDFSARIDIKNGINKTINALQKEQSEQELEIDYEFDIASDCTIAYAVKRNLVKDEEKEVLENYIKSLGWKYRFRMGLYSVRTRCNIIFNVNKWKNIMRKTIVYTLYKKIKKR